MFKVFDLVIVHELKVIEFPLVAIEAKLPPSLPLVLAVIIVPAKTLTSVAGADKYPTAPFEAAVVVVS